MGWWNRGMAVVALACASACGSNATQVAVRSADDVQVMSSDAVAQMRASVTTLVPLTTDGTGGTASTAAVADGAADPAATETTAAADTVPQNADGRSAEQKLFDAYKNFSGCLKDAGYEFHGNPQDPNDPSRKEAGYMEALGTCAARSDIVNVLNEVQTTRASLNPDEVKQRNESWKVLEKCLKEKGWTIETQTDEIGLITPTKFVSSDGKLNERDIEQCSSALQSGSGNG